MTNEKIDVVMLWVDPSDMEWQKEKARYSGKTIDDREIRYRDWDNLQYIFRGIDKFMPWVNNVFFVTWGHLPKWLNTEHPKLRIVNHKDYIPQEYLPTFNSDPIELNLHRIEELSEYFILFNDDTFVLKETVEEDFFADGKPRDAALLNIHCYETESMYTLAPFVNIGIINKYFNFRQVLRNNFSKWFTLKYGLQLLRNIYLLPCPRFPGMRMDHLPCSHLKSTFELIWEKEEELMDVSCKSKFRSRLTSSQWAMKEWNIVSGNFVPRSPKIGKSFGIYKDNIDKICASIKNKKYKLICLNDTNMDYDMFEKCKEKLNASFNAILPEKSAYEK